MSISPGRTTFTINVTEDDFASGIRFNVTRCAVARAIARVTGLKATVVPLPGTEGKVQVIFDGVAQTLENAALRTAIVNFDLGGKPMPIDFELTVPLAALAQVQA